MTESHDPNAIETTSGKCACLEFFSSGLGSLIFKLAWCGYF